MDKVDWVGWGVGGKGCEVGVLIEIKYISLRRRYGGGMEEIGWRIGDEGRGWITI